MESAIWDLGISTSQNLYRAISIYDFDSTVWDLEICTAQSENFHSAICNLGIVTAQSIIFHSTICLSLEQLPPSLSLSLSLSLIIIQITFIALQVNKQYNKGVT